MIEVRLAGGFLAVPFWAVVDGRYVAEANTRCSWAGLRWALIAPNGWAIDAARANGEAVRPFCYRTLTGARLDAVNFSQSALGVTTCGPAFVLGSLGDG